MNRNIYSAQWEVPSHSGEKMYKVSKKHDGTYVCSCPHNIFRKVTCDHIREAMRYEEERVVLERAARRLQGFGIAKIA